MKNKFIFLILSMFVCACQDQNHDSSNLLQTLMKDSNDFDDILENKDRYEIQIIYTQIDRDSANRPSFRSYYFNVDSTRYFYPASTVKLPLVLLAFEKLRRLDISGLDEFTPMLHDSVYSGQISVSRDSTSETGLPSLAHYSKKILVVSDNDAYNRLYEFVGQEEVNRRMHELGYSTTRIIHRLERPLSRDQNSHTERVKFVKNGEVIFEQPMLVNAPVVINERVLKGKGFIRNDSLIEKPFDFTYKNFYPLTEQQRLLKTLLFPEIIPENREFKITDDDRKFVLKYMSQLPRETTFPSYYSDTVYYDSFCKFLMYGNSRDTIPKNIRIFNKIGDAYGYMIDNAYIVDFDAKVEFMLSAIINTNTDEIYNDGAYEYERLGYPFMKKLGQLIYTYELKRERKYKPDLSSFVIQYDR